MEIYEVLMQMSQLFVNPQPLALENQKNEKLSQGATPTPGAHLLIHSL